MRCVSQAVAVAGLMMTGHPAARAAARAGVAAAVRTLLNVAEKPAA